MVKIKELVGRGLSTSNRLIVKEAYKRGVEFEILPKKRFRMKHGDKKYLVRLGHVSATPNTRLSRKLTKYKNATNSILRASGFNAPENTTFKASEVERAWNWAKDILPVVVKPNDGIMGKLVFVKIDNYNEFVSCFNQVSEKYDEVLIEQFIEGEEYRFSFVKDKVVAVAKRVPANVVGDGINNVEQLIKLKNEERAKRKNPLHKKLDTEEETQRVLKKQNLSLNYVPKEREIVYLRNNSNVSTGGDAIDVTNEINRAIKETIGKAVKSIPGLKVCGVDVLIDGDNYTIIEINSHAMLSMHTYPWEGKSIDIASKVVDLMFPNTINK